MGNVGHYCNLAWGIEHGGLPDIFYVGVARTSVAIGTIVGIGSTPILAGPIGYVSRVERHSRR